ncbi:MAG: squalene--hopene cyclase, partial [Terriglobus sp.]
MQDQSNSTGTSAASGVGVTQPRFGRIDLGLDHVRTAARKATDWLLGQQQPDGHWCGELEADVMLEADY